MRTVDEILDKIKQFKGFKKDTELAILFGVKPSTVANWRARKTLPYEIIVSICEKEGLDISWLLAGQIITKYIDIEDKKVLTISKEPGLYKKEEKPLTVAEPSAIYERDAEMAEILEILQKNPQDKKLVLKLLKGKKDIKEALAGFEIKKLLEEEG